MANKLTSSDIQEIRMLLEEGIVFQKEIAERFNITRFTVHRMKAKLTIGSDKHDLEFIRKYYGSIRTADIVKIIGKGTVKGINSKAQYNNIERNPKLYGSVMVEYKGLVYKAQGFVNPKAKRIRVYKNRYKATGNPIGRPKTATPKVRKTGRAVGRPSFKPTPKPKEMSKKIDPIVTRKPDTTKNVVKIKPFVPPEGKRLVYCEVKRGMVYR